MMRAPPPFQIHLTLTTTAKFRTKKMKNQEKKIKMSGIQQQSRKDPAEIPNGWQRGEWQKNPQNGDSESECLQQQSSSIDPTANGGL